MENIEDFLMCLPDNGSKPGQSRIYPMSFNRTRELDVFMIRRKDADYLLASGQESHLFEGESFVCQTRPCVLAPLTHPNAVALRNLFSFCAPSRVLGNERSFGVGDRLGIAGPGHLRVFQKYDAFPVLAQQSIRELTLTHRTFDDVLDCATFAVYREGFKRGFGADGDHLKKPEEVALALQSGYTMITLDCSEHIRNDVSGLSAQEVAAQCPLEFRFQRRYLETAFDVEGMSIHFDEDSLRRCILVYGKAIEFATRIYQNYLAEGKGQADFEISIDETMTPTTPLQHFFVANELRENGVKVETIAPRFCGEFQKGVDYAGDLVQFEAELRIHAAIARRFGYKLSIHSGSDKFSVFALIGKYTKGKFHVKTAGTNWLEAMRVVAIANPKLYREIHAFALSVFSEAKKYYHVTTDLNKIPALESLKDPQLESLFEQNDSRQLIHITYGLILGAKNPDGTPRFRDRLYAAWRKDEKAYSERLFRHIGRHLETLYSGFQNSR